MMTTQEDPRIQAAIEEMRAVISERFPGATFAVGRRDDPEGIYLTTTVDIDDPDDVVDVFIDRLLTMQIDEGIPLYVIPIRTPERIAAMLRDRPTRPRAEALPR